MTLEEISRTIGAAGLLLNGQGSREKEGLFSPTFTCPWNRSNVKFPKRSSPASLRWCTIFCNMIRSLRVPGAGGTPAQTFAASFHLKRFLQCAQSAPRTISSVDDLPVISLVVPILARLTATRSNLRLEARIDSLCSGSVVIRLVEYDYFSGRLI